MFKNKLIDMLAFFLKDKLYSMKLITTPDDILS